MKVLRLPDRVERSDQRSTRQRHLRAALAASPVVLSYLALVAMSHFMAGGGSHMLMLLGIPGVLGFTALVYYLSWSKGAEPSPAHPR